MELKSSGMNAGPQPHRLSLRCPAFHPSLVAGAPGKTALVERVQALSACLVAPEASFGLELKRAWRALNDQEPARDPAWTASEVANCVVQLRGLLLKPAFEPAALSYWPRFVDWSLDLPAAVNLACVLTGRAIRPAAGRMVTRAAPGFPSVAFEAPEEARLWWGKIDAAERDGGHPLDWPIYAYAQTLLSHPMEDGNGRLARALLQGALARRIGLRAPALALAPQYYLRRRTITRALAALSGSGDWPAFFAVMLAVLGEAAVQAEALLG